MHSMSTTTLLHLAPSGRKKVQAAFTGGTIASDGGVLLLREVANKLKLFERMAACFRDHRRPERIEHTVESMLAQRVLGIACGYEDLEDHDILRRDPLFALAAGKRDLVGEGRIHAGDRGNALAGKSTLQRFEATPADAGSASRYKKVVYDARALERLFLDLFLEAHPTPPKEIVLDVDATDDPIHGGQEGAFFNGFYDGYCYLPIYIFCDGFLLAAALRTSDCDPGTAAGEDLARVIGAIRERWPTVRIIVRGDSGFCRDPLLSLFETSQVDYVVGLPRNSRLLENIEPALATARSRHEVTGKPEREFVDFSYKTMRSWSDERRVVGKAERVEGKDNPRFVVTSIAASELDPAALYETLYCARGDMENRIKEQQLGLFADRTSSHTMRANQLRLWLSSFAYVLLHELRRHALAKTKLAAAQVWTIRESLLKIGARVHLSVRRVYVALSSGHPMREVFTAALLTLRNAMAA